MSPVPPRGFSSTTRLYLRPGAIVGGVGAAPGMALPLAGGPLAFLSCEIALREGDAPASHTRASVTEIEAWVDELDRDAAGRVREQLARLSASRPALAGLAPERTSIAGIVNVTPDSFSDGGDHAGPEAAVAHARALVAAGADILDIGGQSTRPGAERVSEAEELDRVLPVIEGLAGDGTPLSIDTRRARVMAAAVAAGAAIVNDTSALAGDPESLSTAAASGVPVVLMHSRGEPRSMVDEARYREAPLEVYDELAARVAACLEAGIPRDRLIVDPGIGFAKTPAHNLEILRHLALFHGLGCTLMLGASRKLGGGGDPKERLAASLSAALWGLSQGVQILRVHDVAETRQAIALWRAIVAAGSD